MNLTYSSVDGWSGDPALSDVPASVGLRCPECAAPVLHIQSDIYDPPVNDLSIGMCLPDAPRLMSWLLIPCQHEVSTRTYELFFAAGSAEFRLKNQEEGS